jgi:carbamate kinase
VVRVKTAVLALGGNALAHAGEPPTVTNQFRRARESMAPIVELARNGWEIVLVHGNGPQVGDELLRNDAARRLVEPLPLGVLVAETAGWIGYMLQQSLQNALAAARVRREVATVITQTLVDQFDPALSRPSKPVGHALSDAEAKRLRDVGRSVGRDGAGNWRRMATSPVPLGVVEFPVVRRLLEQGTIVIAAGGGGPPVYDDPLLGLEGLDAVVDKDRVSAILAAQLEAEVLMILTNVDAVFAGWGTPSARPIRRMSLAEADALVAGDTLDAGGMRPKVEAAAAFVRAGGRRSIIARLSEGPAALRGETGTTITREP